MFRALAALFGYYLAVAMIAVPLSLAVPAAWAAGPFGIAAQTIPLVVGALFVSALLVRQRLADWEMYLEHYRLNMQKKDIRSVSFCLIIPY